MRTCIYRGECSTNSEVIDFNGNASLNQKLILHHLALLVGQFKVWEMQVSIDYIIILNTFF
jgi:hypothetical protein